MNRIRVVLADDHNVVREGLRAVLETAEDIEVVGEAQNGRQAVEMAKALRPDLILLDLAMPLLNGLDAARQISRETPATKILILSSYSDESFVQKLVEAKVGGYVVKQTASTDLLKAIRLTYQGKGFFSPKIAKRMEETSRQAFLAGSATRSGRRANDLSMREAEVLQLIAEGYANKQIADQLSISVKTVEKHRQQIMNKLNIRDVPGLTRYAISRGMIEPPLPLSAIM